MPLQVAARHTVGVRRINWVVVGAAALVGGGLAALVQWWPRAQECAGSGGVPCPSGRIAGTVSAAGVIGGFVAGAAVALLLMLLSDRERRRRDRLE